MGVEEAAEKVGRAYGLTAGCLSHDVVRERASCQCSNGEKRGGEMHFVEMLRSFTRSTSTIVHAQILQKASGTGQEGHGWQARLSIIYEVHPSS